MNNKGQFAFFEYLATYGWVLIVLVMVVGVLAFVITNTPHAPDFISLSNNKLAAENFCKGWADDRGYFYLDGTYKSYLINGWQVGCEYTPDADVFGGGVSPGVSKYKYFEISEEDLLKWLDVNYSGVELNEA